MVQDSSSNSQTQNNQQSGTSGIGADLTAIGQALQSGDVSSAQTAYAKLQQDLQGVRGHHHHHHGGQAGGAQSTSVDSVIGLLTTSSGTGDSSESSSNNGTINITA